MEKEKKVVDSAVTSTAQFVSNFLFFLGGRFRIFFKREKIKERKRKLLLKRPKLKFQLPTGPCIYYDFKKEGIYDQRHVSFL